MKLSCNINHFLDILITVLLMLILLEHKILVLARRKQSDSILEIMNTREIEQMLAERERRLRISTPQNHNSTTLAIHNDLHNNEYSNSQKSDNNRQQNRRKQSKKQNSDENITKNFDYNKFLNKNHKRHHEKDRDISDLFIPYNDTLFADESSADYESDSRSIQVAAEQSGIDLDNFKVDKILKSTKSALYITKKEYLKKDWCKTEPLVQRIREPGCLTRPFINRFCYGQCNSFYIPKGPKRRRNHNNSNNNHMTTVPSRYLEEEHFEDEDLTGAAFRSCAFCKPKKFIWITITIRCPAMVPQLRKKRIQRIKQCRCMSVPLD